MADWSKLPTSLPNGALLPHMSARMRTSTIDALFVAAGGFDRALAWIEKDDENYGEFFMKVWAKGAAKAVSQEINVGEGVEALLDKLDAGEHAKVINGEITDV